MSAREREAMFTGSDIYIFFRSRFISMFLGHRSTGTYTRLESSDSLQHTFPGSQTVLVDVNSIDTIYRQTDRHQIDR